MSLTFKQLQKSVEKSFSIEKADASNNSVLFVLGFDEEQMADTGRDGFSLLVELVSEGNLVFQTALVPDYLDVKDVPLAVAACNAWNAAERWPTAAVCDDTDGNFDIRFTTSLDTDSGSSVTVDDAIQFFPVHAYRGLKWIYSRFGL